MLLQSVKNSDSAVSLLDVYDFSAKGLSDIMLSRDDSSIEWYQPNLNGEIEL